MEVRHDSERMFLDVVERGVAAGSFHCADPWLAVAAIGGMGIRVADWYPNEYIGASPAELCDVYAELA